MAKDFESDYEYEFSKLTDSEDFDSSLFSFASLASFSLASLMRFFSLAACSS